MTQLYAQTTLYTNLAHMFLDLRNGNYIFLLKKRFLKYKIIYYLLIKLFDLPQLMYSALTKYMIVHNII